MDGAAIVKGWQGSGYRLVLGVPILPGTGSLAQGAAGDYDRYFTTLAQNLVSDGEANAILRLGWEFNGSWYPWYVQSSTDAANFDKFWQHIVTTMRAVPGEQFKFLWNAERGHRHELFTRPGLSRQRLCGLRRHRRLRRILGDARTPAAAWSNQLTQQWGLNWLATFAAANGKPIAIPEWSVSIRSDGGGMGDDPAFVANMADWFVAHNVAFDDIFSFDSSGTRKTSSTAASPIRWPSSRPSSADLRARTSQLAGALHEGVGGSRGPFPRRRLPPPRRRSGAGHAPHPLPAQEAVLRKIPPGGLLFLVTIYHVTTRTVWTRGPGPDEQQFETEGDTMHQRMRMKGRHGHPPWAGGEWGADRGNWRGGGGACGAATSAPPCSAPSPTAPPTATS